MTKYEVAQRLRDARLAAGLSRSEVAKTINRSIKIIGHWETGYSAPDIETLMMLLDLYGIDANTFFNVEPKEGYSSSELLNLIGQLTPQEQEQFLPLVRAGICRAFTRHPQKAKKPPALAGGSVKRQPE